MFSATSRVGRTIRTIGFRLTLWGAGFTLLVCVVVCCVLYIGVKLSLEKEVDRFLEGEVHEFMSVVNEHPADLREAQRIIRLHLGSRSRDDLVFRLLIPNGSVLLSSHSTGQLPRRSDQWLRNLAAASGPQFETLHHDAEAHAVRVCSEMVRGPAGAKYVGEAAYALDQVYASLATLRNICGGALVLASFLAYFGGRLLARRSLAPLHRMTASAQQISARGLTERLPRSYTSDELDDLAQTINAMLDRTAEFVRNTQRFTADASHELRTPIAALRGNAEVALTRERSVQELRRVIEESIGMYDRLGRIAEDLLLLARADAGEDVFQLKCVDLDAVIEDVVDLYTPMAADLGLVLAFRERREVSVDGDGGRLRQAIANLIDNAIKYTVEPGRIDVSLTCTNGNACIGVRDTGVGISSEHLPHVFDRFYQVDRSRSQRRSRGAGLGLSICRTIVAAHGGRIEISSTPGTGTLVEIVLPERVAPQEDKRGSEPDLGGTVVPEPQECP